MTRRREPPEASSAAFSNSICTSGTSTLPGTPSDLDRIDNDDKYTYCPLYLDPTQRMAHDYVCDTWFVQVCVAVVYMLPYPELLLKQFGTAGSGKTQCNRTYVVTLRLRQAILTALTTQTYAAATDPWLVALGNLILYPLEFGAEET